MDPEYTKIQLDALSGGVEIRHNSDGTTEISDCGGYLVPMEPMTHTMPTNQVDGWLQEKMESSSYWNERH